MIHFLVNALFVFSVIFIWLMLLYQFVLSIGGFLFWRRLRKRGGATRSDAGLPAVSILIPAHNEEKVIGQLLACLGRMDYPADKIEIIVVNDGSSDGTAGILAETARREGRLRIIDVPPGQGGRGKSAALNLALKQARHEVIAIYDADNLPQADSLRMLCRALVADRRLAAVCGKFRAYNKNRNLLTRMINLEGIAFQWIIQAGRWFFLKISFIPGTNFVVWKRVLEEVGGWDCAALTEDAELTMRIYEHGYRIMFLPMATTWEQEPERLATWFRQRTRWARGNHYLIAKYTRKLLKSRPRLLLVEILNLLMLYYFFIFAIIFSDALFILSLLGLVQIDMIGPYGKLWGLAFLLFLLEIMIAMSYEREDSWRALLDVIVAYLTYTKLWAFVVLRSIYHEYIVRGARVWSKTERYEARDTPPGSGDRS